MHDNDKLNRVVLDVMDFFAPLTPDERTEVFDRVRVALAGNQNHQIAPKKAKLNGNFGTLGGK